MNIVFCKYYMYDMEKIYRSFNMYSFIGGN